MADEQFHGLRVGGWDKLGSDGRPTSKSKRVVSYILIALDGSIVEGKRVPTSLTKEQGEADPDALLKDVLGDGWEAFWHDNPTGTRLITEEPQSRD